MSSAHYQWRVTEEGVRDCLIMGNCIGNGDSYERHEWVRKCSQHLARGLLDNNNTNMLVFNRKDQVSATIQSSTKSYSGVFSPCSPSSKHQELSDSRLVESIKEVTTRDDCSNASDFKKEQHTGDNTASEAETKDPSGVDLRETSASEAHEDSKKFASDLHFYVVTWNMNGKAPLDNISKLLDVTDECYDFYVIGLQEAPSLPVEADIADALGHTYCLVGAAVMMSLQLFVFAKISLQVHISGLKVDKVGVGGFGTVVGRQKGAAAVMLNFKEVSLLFITAHLTPHESNVEARNAQYLRISQNVFARSTSGICSCIPSSAVADEPHCKVPGMTSNFVEESDFVVWLGDLNYRVEMPRSSVGFLINHNLEEVLWAKDQLSRAVQSGQVFKGFEEGPLLFPPTYKYDIGTDNYDTSSKERVPSWTDRILYKVSHSSSIKVELQGYTSIGCVKSSDHRPVKAYLALKNLKESSS